MQLSDNMRGAFIMMLSMAAFTLYAFFLQGVLRTTPLFQAILIQGATASVLLLAIAGYRREISLGLSSKDWALVSLRAFAEAGAIVFYFLALAYLGAGNVLFTLQLSPLIVTIAAFGIMRDNVSIKHFVMLALGLTVALFVLQPTGVPMEGFQNYLFIAKAFGIWTVVKSIFWDHFNIYVVYAIATLAFVVLRDVATRNLSQAVRSSNVTLITAAVVTMIGAIGTVSTGWSNVDPIVLIPLAITAILSVGVLLFGVIAIRLGDVGFVQYYRYFSIVVAMTIGVILFGDELGSQTLLGSLAIVGIGVYGLITQKRI
jgi:drug/metabolite transporter (DMT)-like permease